MSAQATGIRSIGTVRFSVSTVRGLQRLLGLLGSSAARDQAGSMVAGASDVTHSAGAGQLWGPAGGSGWLQKHTVVGALDVAMNHRVSWFSPWVHSSGGWCQAGGMQVHNWRGWLLVSPVSQASDRDGARSGARRSCRSLAVSVSACGCMVSPRHACGSGSW